MKKDREPARRPSEVPMINVEGILFPSRLGNLTSRDLQAYGKVVDILSQSPDLPIDALKAFGDAQPVVDVLDKYVTQQEEIQELRERANGRYRDNRRYDRREFLGKAAKIVGGVGIGLAILGTCGDEIYSHELSPDAQKRRTITSLEQKKKKEATQMLGLGTSDISHTGWTVQLPPQDEATQYTPTSRPPQFIQYDYSSYQYIKFINLQDPKKTDSTDITLKSYVSSEGIAMTEIHIIVDGNGDKSYRLLPIQPDADGLLTSGIIEMVEQKTEETKYIKIDPIEGSSSHFKVTEMQKQTS